MIRSDGNQNDAETKTKKDKTKISKKKAKMDKKAADMDDLKKELEIVSVWYFVCFDLQGHLVHRRHHNQNII